MSSCTGMDAQVSYAFHSERKLHPEKYKNQLVNQVLALFSALRNIVTITICAYPLLSLWC